MNIHKALVVDDSRVAHVLLNKLLRERSIEVDWVGSGKEAVQYLKSQRADVVFMDVMMPGMDGFETTDTITKDPSIFAPPIIMCSANATDEDHDIAKRCGAKGFLSKPYSPDELDDVLTMVRELPEPEPVALPEPVAMLADADDSADDYIPLLLDEAEGSAEPVPEPAPVALAQRPPEPLSVGVVSGDAAPAPLNSREISDIARKVATQAAQTAAAEAARTAATEVTRQLLKEAESRIVQQAEKAAQTAAQAAQAAAVEAAKAVVRQAFKVISEKMPNADVMRKELSATLEEQITRTVKTVLTGEEFKRTVARQAQEAAKPLVEATAREVAQAAAFEQAQAAANQVVTELAMPAAEEAVKAGLKQVTTLAYAGIGLGAVALLLALASMLGVL